ncbi:MAG: CDGSH iron-sulfur domain-containing protein [Alphaproteobacteria bacterium]|nr:CDGSH iron-sulfur domain-containing protein [Alphaproteobacteria bacterium]
MAETGPQDADTPQIARLKPYFHALEKGKSYFWCACGRSKSQPFCDGSHRGTRFRPITYVAKEDGEEVLFCGCKQSCDKPFCDGAHNNLPGAYALDDPESAENRAVPTVAADASGKALLDGGCYVRSIQDRLLKSRGTVKFGPMITAADGAKFQSLFYIEAARGASPVAAFGERDVILFVSAGKGAIEVSGRRFAAGENAGVHVRPGEAFRIHNDADAPMKVFAAACPLADDIAWAETMPANFDAAHPDRVVALDPAMRVSMGARFFQLLVDKRIGSTVVTQFIGEIPLSKAAPHRHLYEESLLVLSGGGRMWTDGRKAAVAAGDVIFLPRKQIHSLECTDPAGMMLVGVIYPGDNPSINY